MRVGLCVCVRACVRVLVCVCLCVYVPAEGERKGIQPGVHVPAALRSREGFQRQHAGHSALPGDLRPPILPTAYKPQESREIIARIFQDMVYIL